MTDSRAGKIVVSARANEGRLSVLHIAVEVPMRFEVIDPTCMTAGKRVVKKCNSGCCELWHISTVFSHLCTRAEFTLLQKHCFVTWGTAAHVCVKTEKMSS